MNCRLAALAIMALALGAGRSGVKAAPAHGTAFFDPAGENPISAEAIRLRRTRRWSRACAVVLAALWTAVLLVVPLRAAFVPGDARWTGEHYGSPGTCCGSRRRATC